MMPVYLTRDQAYNNSLCVSLCTCVRGPWDKELHFRGVRLTPTGEAGQYNIQFYEAFIGRVECDEEGIIKKVDIFSSATNHLMGAFGPDTLLVAREAVGTKLTFQLNKEEQS